MSPLTYTIGDQLELCFNGIKFPCSIIKEAKVSMKQDITEVRGLCGLAYTKKKTPTGEVEVTFNYRNQELLSALFPAFFVAGSGGCTGGLLFGQTGCTAPNQGGVLNIHPLCDADATNPDNAKNDFTAWFADPILDTDIYNFTEGGEEEFTVKFTLFPAPSTLAGGGANPHAGQVAQIGTPGCTEPLVFDCATQDFIPA